MPTPDDEQLYLYPRHDEDLAELTITLSRVETDSGHRYWRWSVSALCSRCGPVALAVEPAPPFTPSGTLGAAAQRLVRVWSADALAQSQVARGQTHQHDEHLLESFRGHLELRHTLDNGS